MKKLLLFATVLLAMVGCKDDEVTPEEPKADKVEVLPTSKDFDNNGGSVSVMVTSTGEWTLSTKENATYDWVSTDKTKGADGDMIKFTVAANETTEARHAYYVFTSGKATAEFKITSFAGEVKAPSITIDEKEIVKDYNAGSFDVLVKFTEGVDYRDIQAVIPEETTWLKHKVTLEGDEEGQAKMRFEYEALAGLEGREASFTINYDEVSVPMTLTQTPMPVINAEPSMISIGLEGGTVSVKVSANVEYNVEVTEGSEWLTEHANADGTHSWKCATATSKRTATIKFTEAAPAEGAEPVVATVKVVQSNALITKVAKMDNLRAILGNDEGANKNVLKLGKQFTIEALVYPTSTRSVNAIVGLERRFLIRHSDLGKPGKWEVVYALNRESSGEKVEEKVQSVSYDLSLNKWNHLAVTVDGKDIKLYWLGVLTGRGTCNADMMDVDFTETYTANRQKQEFAIGYAYDNGRFFNGSISEVRIWNKALTQNDLKAKDHFYSVDPASEGLVAYWKINDGQGSVFKDYTANKNNLHVQEFRSPWQTANAVWEDVSLPE